MAQLAPGDHTGRDRAVPTAGSWHRPKSRRPNGTLPVWSGGVYEAYVQSPPVVVTERAARKALQLAEREKVAAELRLGVRGGGCSGLSYYFEFEKPATPADVQWEVAGLRVCIDPKSLTFLRGCELDFEDTGLLKRGFRFRNPNAKQSCSCGESFTL